MKQTLAVFLSLLILVSVTPTTAQDDGIPPRGNRLFVDDFTTYVNRWDRLQSGKFTVDYVDFAYQFQMRSPGVDVWAMPKTVLAPDRYVIDVTAEVGPDSAPESFFGLMLNYQDEASFYVFGIKPTGEFEVRLRLDDEWVDTPLIRGQAPPANSYRLHVENDRGVMEVTVDDYPPVSFSSTELGGGQFGLYAQAGRGALLVTFDNYLVHDVD